MPLASRQQQQLGSVHGYGDWGCFSHCNVDAKTGRRPGRVGFLPLHLRRLRLVVSASSCPERDNQVLAGGAVAPPTARNHNSKSTALLFRRLSLSSSISTKADAPPPRDTGSGIALDTTASLRQHEEGDKIDEAEVLGNSPAPLLAMRQSGKRVPSFPGSIIRYEGTTALLGVSLRGQGGAEVKRAIEMRRNVAADILTEIMRGPGGKFSKTYSENIVSRLPTFIDRAVVAAAYMKQQEEFSHSTFEARVKAYINDSKIVPLIRWLKHNSMTYHHIGKLICTTNSEDLDSTIRGLVSWLKTIYVKGEFLGRVLTKADDILERDPAKLEEIVQFLEKRGVRREWMGFVVSRCPQILSFAMPEVESRANFYLSMGMNEKDFGTMLFDCPKALGGLSLELMNTKVEYLKEFGLSNEEVGRLLAFKPQLMVCSIEERWNPLVKYLYYLGVQRDGMRRILTMKPMIFCLDLETTIAPKVRFLQDIGVQEEAVGAMLVKFPPILTYSLHKKIRPVVIFLMTKAGVLQRDIGKVIALEPELLGCSMHKLEDNVKYFLSLGITIQSLGMMIADFPMLLRYNLDILRPKYRYLRRTMVRTLQDLIEFPRFFSYSLEGRIIPRHKIMVENKLNFKLRYMLALSDEKFEQHVQAALHRRELFPLCHTANEMVKT